MCDSICMYVIRFAEGVLGDLKALRASDRRRIMEGIQRKLPHEPTRQTKHVKRLEKLLPPFEHVPPIRQLRIGDFRVFYDVNDAEGMVLVRAIRRKPAHMTTEGVL